MVSINNLAFVESLSTHWNETSSSLGRTLVAFTAIFAMVHQSYGKPDFDTLEVLETIDFGRPAPRFRVPRRSKPKIDPIAKRMLEAFVSDTNFHTLSKLKEVDFQDGKPARTKIFGSPRMLGMKHREKTAKMPETLNLGRAINEFVFGHPLLMVFKRK